MAGSEGAERPASGGEAEAMAPAAEKASAEAEASPAAVEGGEQMETTKSQDLGEAEKAGAGARAGGDEMEDLFGSGSSSSSEDEDEEKAKKGEGATPPTGEGEKGQRGEEELEDLFGGDSESESDKANEVAKVLMSDDDDEEDEDEEAIVVDIAPDEGIDLLESNSSKRTIAKLSNLIGFEHKEFKPESVDEDEERGRQQPFVIRWRRGKDGKVESNARLLRWSDGSSTLQVGEEHFEVLPQDVSTQNLFAFARHQEGEFMEGCAGGDLAQRYSFRPMSLKTSKALAHAKQGSKVNQEKKQTAKKITVLENPMQMNERRVKEEEDRIKQLERMERKQQSEMAKYGLTPDAMGRDRGDRYDRYSGGLTAEYLEGSEDEDGGQDWDEDASRRAREELARGRHMGDERGEKRILSAKDGDAEQSIKRQKFARGLDESSEDDDDEEEDKDKRGTRGKAVILTSDDEED